MRTWERGSTPDVGIVSSSCAGSASLLYSRDANPTHPDLYTACYKRFPPPLPLAPDPPDPASPSLKPAAASVTAATSASVPAAAAVPTAATASAATAASATSPTELLLLVNTLPKPRLILLYMLFFFASSLRRNSCHGPSTLGPSVRGLHSFTLRLNVSTF